MDITRSHSLDCQVESGGLKLMGVAGVAFLCRLPLVQVVPAVERAIDCEILHE